MLVAPAPPPSPTPAPTLASIRRHARQTDYNDIYSGSNCLNVANAFQCTKIIETCYGSILQASRECGCVILLLHLRHLLSGLLLLSGCHRALCQLLRRLRHGSTPPEIWPSLNCCR
ncbi:hypothetical protein VTK56DRAFT_8364 [Thermocarpiscus australiensis]